MDLDVVAKELARFLHDCGMKPDTSLVPKSTDDYMTYCHFNGHTLAYDDEGGGWSSKGCINLAPHFTLRQVQIVE